MSISVNCLGGGGGSAKSVFPSVYVYVRTGSTVTIKKAGVDDIPAEEIETGVYFAELPEYGVYTVYASKGNQTANGVVAAYEVACYNISLNYTLWLYRDGDECTAATGGWLNYPKAVIPAHTIRNVIKYSTYMYQSIEGVSETAAVYTARKINITDYNKIVYEVTTAPSPTSGEGAWGQFGLIADNSLYYQEALAAVGCWGGPTNRTTVYRYELPIEGWQGSYYVAFGIWSWGSMAIHRIWLE